MMACNWLFCWVFILSALVESTLIQNFTRPYVVPVHRHYKFRHRTPSFRDSIRDYLPSFPILDRFRSHWNKLTLQSTTDETEVTGCTSSGFSIPLITYGGTTQEALLDTGSATLALAGANCKNCAVSPLYHPGPTAVNTQIPTSSFYVDGSGWEGTVYIDNITLAPMPSVNMAFASISSQSGGFFTYSVCNGYIEQNQSQGIIGFAYPSILTDGTDVYFDKLVEEQNIPDIFALQLCRTTGRLWLGGYNSTFFNGSLQWTPIVNETYYVVNMTDITVNGQSVGFPPSFYEVPAVDSGTSILAVPIAVYQQLISLVSTPYFVNEFGGDFWNRGECASPKSGADTVTLNANLPKMSVVLQDVTLDMLAVSSYLYEVETGLYNPRYYYCPGILANSDPTDNSVILGWPIMNQFTTVFDRANARVGFAPTLYCNAEWDGTWSSCNANTCGEETSIIDNATCVDYPSGTPVPSEYCLSPIGPLVCSFCNSGFATWKPLSTSWLLLLLSVGSLFLAI